MMVKQRMMIRRRTATLYWEFIINHSWCSVLYTHNLPFPTSVIKYNYDLLKCIFVFILMSSSLVKLGVNLACVSYLEGEPTWACMAARA